MKHVLNAAALIAATVAWVALGLGEHLHATTHAVGHGGTISPGGPAPAIVVGSAD